MFAGRAVRIMIHAYRLCLVGTGCTVLCVTKCQVLFSCVLSGRQSGGVIITLYTACQSTVHPSPDMRRTVTDQQTQDIDPMLFYRWPTVFEVRPHRNNIGSIAYVHWVTIQLVRDVDAELANIRTTSRQDINNPPVTLIQYTALMSRPRVFIHT